MPFVPKLRPGLRSFHRCPAILMRSEPLSHPEHCALRPLFNTPGLSHWTRIVSSPVWPAHDTVRLPGPKGYLDTKLVLP